MGEADAGTPSFEMTWSSTTSSGYCSQEDSDSELEQYFTARTSLVRRPRRDQVRAGGCGPRARGGRWDPPLPGKFPWGEFVGNPALPSAWITGQPPASPRNHVSGSLRASVLGAEALLCYVTDRLN